MYGEKFKEATNSLLTYCREQMGYDNDPDVHYVTDQSNANNMLGYTAHYQPDNKVVTVYISNRHPKDVLRSLAHELVHHAQNCRGDLQNSQTEQGYAQKDPHMRKMEEEAYLKGNMMFRDWEDSCKEQNMILPSTIGEQKMDDKLKKLVAEKVVTKLQKEGIEISEGPLDRMMARASGLGAGLKARAGNFKSKVKGAVAGYKGDSDTVAATAAAQKDPAAAKAEARFKSIVSSAYKDVGIIQQDIVKNFKKMGLNRDKRGGGTIVDNKELQNALRFLRSSQNALSKAMGLSDEEMKKMAAFAVVKEEENQIEEGMCPKCNMNPCGCPMHEEVEELKEGAPVQISKDSIKQHSKDLAKNYGDAETASLILRGASQEDLMSALEELLSSGHITSGQLQAAASKMQDVSAKYGTMEESEGADLEEKSLGSSPGAGIDKFVEKGMIPVIKVVGKGAARTAGAGVGAAVGALKGAGKGAKDGYDFVKNKLGLEEEELEEGGAAQRHDNLDRLRRQEPDRIKEEEEVEEAAKPDFPDVDGDGDRKEPISKAQKDKKEKEGGKKDKKESDDGEEKSDKDLSKVPPQLRKHVAKKKVNENELINIKKNQSSIDRLNETRLTNINKELMRRLIK